MKQIRILHCNNDNKNMGGAYLVERKLEPYIREKGYIFDYITMDEFVDNGDKNTDPLDGSRTFSAKLRGNKIIGHIKLPFFVKKVLHDNPYMIVHIDIDSAWKALLYAVPAKKMGAKVIIHSHATGIDGNHKGIKFFFHKTCKKMLGKYSDKYIGCSNEALKWLCPESKKDSSELLVNGLDTSEFYYNESVRNECRKELDLENSFVICNVGRINENKNQVFLVDVLVELKKLIPNAVLLLVGPYTEENLDILKAKIKMVGVDSSVIISGPTNNVNKVLNASDYFVLPSKFEGFSLASIEAQSTGLNCLLSTGTPDEVKVSELAERVDISLGAKEWAQIIYQKSITPNRERKTLRLNNEYTMEGMAQHLSNIYDSLIGG